MSDLFPEYYLLCVNNFDDTATAPGLAQARELLQYDRMNEQEAKTVHPMRRN